MDTNSVIDYLDNKLPSEANKIIDTIEFRISVITRIELLSWSGASKEQTIILNDFINACDVYSLEEPIILKTIEIRKTKKTKLPDAIIAATAAVKHLTIVTRNTKDFDNIKGIRFLNPYEI